MRRAVWASLFHCMSTDESPQHDRCSAKWCFYLKAIENGDPMLAFEDSLSGIRIKELPQDPTFLDYHKLFMTDNVYTTITMETNR